MPYAGLGALRFDFGGHGLATYPAGATFGPRTLKDYELVWIVDGEVVWDCDGVRHAAPPGTVLLARPGMRDGFVWDPLRPTRHGYFHFRFQAHGAVLPDEADWPLTRMMGRDDILRPLFHHLGWLLDTRPAAWEELAQGAMRQLLAAYLSGSSGSTGDGVRDEHPIVERTVAHVQRVWSGGRLVQVPLALLAEAAGVSRAHLSRVFRAALGATPIEAFRLMRLDRAAVLLARTNAPIAAIADQCGFDNAFHFSRCFRAAYACSPRAFRRQLGEGRDMPAIRLVRVREISSRMTC